MTIVLSIVYFYDIMDIFHGGVYLTTSFFLTVHFVL